MNFSELKALAANLDPAVPIFFLGPPGAGKCLGAGTPVVLADGRVLPVEKIECGDRLAGPSGPRTVTSTTKGHGPLYCVEPVKGEPWVCNGAHVLTLVNTDTGDVVDVEVGDYLSRSANFRGRHKLFSVGVETFENDVSRSAVDPYFLGVWFGGGTKTIKEVPDQILRGNCETRRSFLAGFLDSDAELSNNCFMVTQKRKDLARSIWWIARSLGLCATISERVGRCQGGFEGIYYTVSISGNTDRIPTRIPRKIAQPRKQRKNATRTGFAVFPVGEGDYYGFELDGDGRFLLGDFTVTHNSALSREIGEAMASRAAAAGTTSIVVRRELTGHLPEDMSGVPFRDGQWTEFCPPKFLGLLAKGSGPGGSDPFGVLVLEDIPAASKAVQVACFQLVQERSMGSVQLSPNVRVILTGNRASDKAGARDLPSPLRNRVCILSLEPDLEEWMYWAASKKLPAVLGGFLTYRRQFFTQTPDQADKENGQFATPRCYDAETEVLTRRGFVRWPDVTEADEFAQMDVETGRATYTKATRLYRGRHVGEMIRFKGQHVDLCVTPNHNMLVEPAYVSGGIAVGHRGRGVNTNQRRDDRRGFSLVPAEQVAADLVAFGSYGVRFRKDATFGGSDAGSKIIGSKKIPWHVWAEFLGWYLTDGYLSPVTTTAGNVSKGVGITQVDAEMRGRVAQLMASVSDNPVRIYNDRVRVTDAALFDELSPMGRKHDGGRYVPRDVLEKGARTLRALVTGAWGGDGWTNKGASYICVGPNRRLADDIMEAQVRLGLCGRVGTRRTCLGRTLYTVTVMGRRYLRPVLGGSNIEKIAFSGEVYCAEVPNHTLLVRRNGHAVWCGNSWENVGRLYSEAMKFGKGSYGPLQAVVSGLIGNGVAAEFCAFVKLKEELPDPKAVLDDPEKALPNPPDRADKLAALVTALGDCAAANQENDAKIYLKLLLALAHVSKKTREGCAAGISVFQANGGNVSRLVSAADGAKKDPRIIAMLKFFAESIK